MATIPDRDEHRRRFASLDLADRRVIVRAVNRGERVDKRKLAPLAVGVARRQMRFWKYGWLVAPAMGIAQVFFLPPEVVLLNTLVATLTLAAMSLFFHRRAARAERLNLEFAAGPSAASRSPERASGFGRHLPGRAGQQPDAGPSHVDTGETDGGDGGPSTQPGHKPYRPRGRKRR